MRSASSWLRAIGALLTVAGLAWVGWVLVRDGEGLAATFESPRLFAALCLSAVLYSVATLLGASAWWWLLAVYGERPRWRAGYSLWARTQVAKYLPGNVFHYVSRQALGRRLGLGHAALGGAAYLELMSILVAAALLGVGALVSSPVVGGRWGALAVAAAIGVLGVLAFWIGDKVLRRWVERGGRFELPEVSSAGWVRLLAPSLGLHLVFLAATSGLLWILAWAVSPEGVENISLWHAVGVYSLAWAAGTVTLGAPAGLGVREAILTLQLTPVLGAAPAAAVALALRFATLFGDLLTALAGYALSGSEGEAPAPRA